MAILPLHYIRRDAILREKTRKVRDFNDPALHKLAEDMIDSLDY